jgi:hypothetical protein
MDFNKDLERPSAAELSADQSKRFREELLRALGPFQAPSAGQRSPRSVLIQRSSRGVPSMASASRYPPSEQVSLKPTLFACSAMLAIAVGVFIGITIAGVDIERVAFPDLSVTRRLVQLVGASEDTLKRSEAAAMLNAPTAQAQPSQPLSQAQTTEPAALADHPPSSEAAPSNVEPLRLTDLTQPAAATLDHSHISSVGKDENVPTRGSQGPPVAASAALSLSPTTVLEEKNSELYRQFLAWRDKDERPQAASQPTRSFRRVANVPTSRTDRANLNSVSGNRSDISSRANENAAHANQKDQNYLVRNAARSGEVKQTQ